MRRDSFSYQAGADTTLKTIILRQVELRDMIMSDAVQIERLVTVFGLVAGQCS